MKEKVEFTVMDPKIFDVDREGIGRRIIDLVTNKNGFQTEIECNVLMCFKNMGYCIRKCSDYDMADGLTQKSCRDYLSAYVKEL